MIDCAITETMLPRLMHILSECQDPIPMFGLRLVSSVTEANPKHLKAIKQIQGNNSTSFVQLLASFYQLNHPRLNRHTIQLMRSLISQRELLLDDLQ